MAQKRKTGRPAKIPGQKDTAERIFDAAIDLFAQKGYDNVSIRDIATAVGIKESSIYKHYTNKEAILQKIIQYPIAKIYAIAATGRHNRTTHHQNGRRRLHSRLRHRIHKLDDRPQNPKNLRIFYIELYHNDANQAILQRSDQCRRNTLDH